MNNKKENINAYKVVLIGDSGVGKSSIIQNYLTKKFSPKYDTTIGTDFISKKIELDNNFSINMQIWDTAGQECFRSLIKSFFHNTQAFFIVYDISNQDSFISINDWLNQIAENSSDPIKVLVGNKTDLEKREVTKEMGEKAMKEKNMHLFFETSAMSGEQVEQVFVETAKLILFNTIKKEQQEKPLFERKITLSDGSLKNPILNISLSQNEAIQTSGEWGQPSQKKCC